MKHSLWPQKLHPHAKSLVTLVQPLMATKTKSVIVVMPHVIHAKIGETKEINHAAKSALKVTISDSVKSVCHSALLALLYPESAVWNVIVSVSHVQAQQIFAQLAARKAHSTSCSATSALTIVLPAWVKTLEFALTVNFPALSALQHLRSAKLAPKMTVWLSYGDLTALTRAPSDSKSTKKKRNARVVALDVRSAT